MKNNVLSYFVLSGLIYVSSGYMFFYANKNKRKERKGAIVFYYYTSLLLAVEATLIILKQIYIDYYKYENLFLYLQIAMVILLFVFIIFLGITHKGSKKDKILISVGILLIVVPLSFLFFILFVL